MLTLITAAILGIVLAGALELSQQQYQSVVRSQVWNSVMPACEAGVEEALAHLNEVGEGDRATNGWVLTNGVYELTRTISGSRYEVSISPANPPVVTSVGYLLEPLGTNEVTRTVQVNTSRAKTGLVGLVAKGAVGLGALSIVDSWDSRETGAYSSSGVKSNAFLGAVNGNVGGGTIVKGDVGTGPTGTVDTGLLITGDVSHDLSRSFPDVEEPFSRATLPPTSGTVTVTNFSSTNSVIVTNVYPDPAPSGGVITNVTTATNTSAPGGGVSYTTQSASVTTSVWPGAAASPSTNVSGWLPSNGNGVPSGNVPGDAYDTRVNEGHSTKLDYRQITGYVYTQTEYVYTLTNFTYSTSGTNAVSVTTTTYDYVLSGGNYYDSAPISMSGQSEMIVTGASKLWAAGGLSLGGQAKITILPGASLELYIGDTSGSSVSCSLAGNGILNLNGDSEKLSVWGLPTCTEVKVAGNGAFIGSIYAPQATLTGKGGGNDVDDIQGAAVVGAVSFTGHLNFHYDEKLGDVGGFTIWRIASWTEL